MTAQRIQRKRTKGWRMPEGAVYVGRPTKWGNPFWHQQRFHGVERSLALYAQMARGIWVPSLVSDWPDSYVKLTYADHSDWVKRIGGHPFEAISFELGGHDLACWCPLDAPCHADVLLELVGGDQ